jgi:hypothetical protein
MKPQTRRSGLLTRELPDELLVYDRERHRAHCLNRTAAFVFRHADGTRTPREIAQLLDASRPAEAEEVVALTIHQLREAGLIEADGTSSTPLAGGLSRREAARRVGIAAAILLPAVATVLAPTPAEAAATCVTSCAGQPHGTQCNTFGPPCVDICSCGGGTCNAGDCTDGNGA